ncbi:hypothetical protein COT95_02410, partial [Candidatus Falkowbacteria bacterium CG10_big_fil_rev_8_21_14_0_10_37_6]
GLKKEFYLFIINKTGADVYMESKRAIKKGTRIVAAKMLKDRKDFIQNEIFTKIPSNMASRFPSFSLTNSRAIIEITANFNFCVRKTEWNGNNFQVTIGREEN